MESRLSDLSLSLRGGMDAIAATEKKQMELFFTETRTLNEKLIASEKASSEAMRLSIDQMRSENSESGRKAAEDAGD